MSGRCRDDEARGMGKAGMAGTAGTRTTARTTTQHPPPPLRATARRVDGGVQGPGPGRGWGRSTPRAGARQMTRTEQRKRGGGQRRRDGERGTGAMHARERQTRANDTWDRDGTTNGRWDMRDDGHNSPPFPASYAGRGIFNLSKLKLLPQPPRIVRGDIYFLCICRILLSLT
jgi:hypothetical protein